MNLNLPVSTAHNTHSLPFNWRSVGLLLALFAIPGIPAIFILALVIAGALSPALVSPIINAAYYDTPLVIIVHGFSGVMFFLTMPFQFSTRLRALKPRYHKVNGYLAFLSGCIMAASGVWMHYVFSPTPLNE